MLSPEEQAKLAYVRELMGNKRYDEAKEILLTMRENPQAQQWLETISHLAPTTLKQKHEEIFVDDLYGQDEFPDVAGDIPFKQKNAPYLPLNGEPKSYLTTAVITLILYWGFWPAGLFANIIYLREARRLQREGLPAENVGCLWALILFNLIPFVFLCALAIPIFMIAN